MVLVWISTCMCAILLYLNLFCLKIRIFSITYIVDKSRLTFFSEKPITIYEIITFHWSFNFVGFVSLPEATELRPQEI